MGCPGSTDDLAAGNTGAVAAHPQDGLIGREHEIAVGRARLEALRGGAAGVVAVEGEAGIGKTALVDGYAAVASGMGIAVVRGAAHPFERNRPYRRGHRCSRTPHLRICGRADGRPSAASSWTRAAVTRPRPSATRGSGSSRR